jgi:hypothetical protein
VSFREPKWRRHEGEHETTGRTKHRRSAARAGAGCQENISGVPEARSVSHLTSPYIGLLARLDDTLAIAHADLRRENRRVAIHLHLLDTSAVAHLWKSKSPLSASHSIFMKSWSCHRFCGLHSPPSGISSRAVPNSTFGWDCCSMSQRRLPGFFGLLGGYLTGRLRPQACLGLEHPCCIRRLALSPSHQNRLRQIKIYIEHVVALIHTVGGISVPVPMVPIPSNPLHM